MMMMMIIIIIIIIIPVGQLSLIQHICFSKAKDSPTYNPL